MDFLRKLERLAKASYQNSDDIVPMVEEIVPTFHPVGKQAKNDCNTQTLKIEIKKLDQKKSLAIKV